MPIDIRFDEVLGILRAEVRGQFTLGEIEQGLRSLRDTPGIPADIPALWDLRRLDFQQMDRNRLAGMIEIRARHPERGRARLALLVQGDLSFGVSRMYEMLSESRGLPQVIQVFTDAQNAEDWLVGRGNAG